MFPAARITDPITHDMLVPSGIIGPPAPAPCPFCPSAPVIIEGMPAAHVMCTSVCSGAISAGIAHPPIPIPPAPPPPILKGSLTVFIHAMPALRWSPAPDITLCGAFLGDPKLAAMRRVFIGDVGMGAPGGAAGGGAGAGAAAAAAPAGAGAGDGDGKKTLKLRIVIVKGSHWDSEEGRAQIQQQIDEAERLLGINIETGEWETVDDASLLTVDGNGPWDGTDNYTDEETNTMNTYGSDDTPAVVFTDKVGGPRTMARTVSNAWAGSDDNLDNEGVLMGQTAANDDNTLAHELGHLLSGETGNDTHSDDPNNLMYESSPAGEEWTDPWKSSANNSPYLN